jgi:hypothetical protein
MHFSYFLCPAADIEQLVQDIPVQPSVVVPVRTVHEAVAAGDLPPLDADAANVFHGANAFCRTTSVDTMQVDHDMHERLMRAVEEGDIEVIDMWEEGDGPLDNTFVKRKVSKVSVSQIP